MPCLALAVAAGAAGAAAVTIPAPEGVGDVAALVAALEQGSSPVWLEPGVYDLKDVAMEEASHLVVKAGVTLCGRGEKPGDTVLLGGGEAVGRRVARFGYGNYSHTTASNLTFTGGYAKGTENGGAIQGGGSTWLQDCIISNNVCGGSWQGGGGGVFKARAERCLFVDNACRGETIGGSGGAHGGGLWCNEETNLNDKETGWQGAYDCVFSNCWARSQGGGAHGANCFRCKFRGCDANEGGGASGGVLVDCLFEGNRVRDGKGGGARKPTAVTNCVFRGNYVDYEYAGGLWTDGDAPVIGCLFEGNSAGRAGGGMVCSGGLVSNCVFRCNESRKTHGGGGLYAPEPDKTLTAAFKVVDCHFEGNTSSTMGGAVCFSREKTSGPDVGFLRCSFHGNVAGSDGGGGVWTQNGVFRDCSFVTNSLSQWGRGGGIHAAADAPASLVGCVLSGNAANVGCIGCNADFTDCVITNHDRGANALYDANLTRCLVADNVTSEGANMLDFASTPNARTNVNCVFVRNRQTAYGSISSAKVIVNCAYLDNDYGNSNYGEVFGQESLAFNSVFSGNRRSGTTPCDIRTSGLGWSDRYPTLVNCIFSETDGAADGNGNYTDCQQVARDRLRYATHDAARPLMPSRRSPMYNRGHEADWLLALVGGTDYYGRARQLFGRIDIGPAECDVEPTGIVILVR